jgi:uncharacterized membrane protein
VRAYLPDLLPGLALAALLVWWNGVLLSHFYGLVYAWADLGLINDWYTNTLQHGRPFWITETAFNHLRTHFAPTALLALPAYLVTDSQYVLPALGTAAMAAALWIGHRLWSAEAAGLIASRLAVAAWSTFFVLAIGANRYVREVLDAAHVEVFAVPLALGFFYARLRGQRLWPAILLFALALGVREEAGLFLGAQALALALLPYGRLRERRWQNVAFAAAGVAYVLLVVKVVNPLLLDVGDMHVQRGWSQWGGSWPAVAWSIATSPVRTLRAVADSAFLPLNSSFGFVPWLHPVAALLVNLPAVLLYCGSEAYQRQLWYYNAAFLLPGFMLLAYAGGWRLAGWLGRLALRPRLFRPAAAAAAGVALAALVALYRDRHTCPEGTFARADYPPARTAAAVVRRWSRRCGGVPRVATDVRHVVYAPLASERYALRHVDRADLAFVFSDADLAWTGAATPAGLWRLLEGDRRFVLAEEGAGHRVYVRRGGACDGLVPAADARRAATPVRSGTVSPASTALTPSP